MFRTLWFSLFHRLPFFFRKFKTANRMMSHGPMPLDGGRLGYLDRVLYKGDELVLEGWSPASHLVLYAGDEAPVETVPQLPREDVVAHGLVESETCGFILKQLYADGQFVLLCYEIHKGDTARSYALRLTPFSKRQIFLNTIGLMLQFAAILCISGPALVRWFVFGHLAARTQVLKRLGLDSASDESAAVPHIIPDVFAQSSPVQPSSHEPITIIVPIFNAFDLLPDMLRRVLDHTDVAWHLILIEDHSTDAHVRPWVRTWVDAARQETKNTIELLENAQNLGFIKSVNRGFERARELGQHVVLLNTDAFVPAQWASRLLHPLEVHGAASATPMSNDAEIFSIPVMCQRTPIKEGLVDRLDAHARRLDISALPVFVPTGVGFCMALHKDFLGQVPLFDTVFGKGYGEEVDWCQKVRALGGVHMAVPNLFVEHRGGESFGSELKQKLIQQNNTRVASRYPSYDQDVQNFIKSDPLVTARLALALAFVSEQQAQVSVYFAHSIGGGAEHYLQNRIRDALKQGDTGAVVVRVTTSGAWDVEVVTAGGLVQGRLVEFDDVARVLNCLPSRRIVYSCAVGVKDSIAFPTRLCGLCREGGADQLEVLVHDYFMVSPSYTLLDSQSLFQGVPIPNPDDAAHQTMSEDGTLYSLTQWQGAWGALLAQADQVVVFSKSSFDIIKAVYPDLDDTLTIVPHVLHTQVSPLQITSKSGRQVIGVLGNIGLQKGAPIVARLAQYAQDTDAFDIVVIGNFDMAYYTSPKLQIHGDYKLSDLQSLVDRYGITQWFIPSIWPETFCYTVHEALATTLPTYAFAIGSQGNTVARIENGVPIAMGVVTKPIEVLVQELGILG